MAIVRNFTLGRYVPWGGDMSQASFVFIGYNWADAAIKMQLKTDLSSSAVATLTEADWGDEGIYRMYYPEIIHPQSREQVGGTILAPFMTEATIEGLSYSGTTDLVLYYDMHVTPVSEVKRTVAEGTLTIKTGVTQ
ncbi:hypothetical protein GRI39_01935 [Altererythrobacter indicus]|uniref:Uncharacterized protein n=1 Tax=Altericroceibacterium indicum TaxID=374177 RepID=A0A845A8B4_9SPHN|nr:hypothetical protein [Altericroceibacterium indicum]MXP24806.1 hypothetical protein [Altericroceibacterium indicum]